MDLCEITKIHPFHRVEHLLRAECQVRVTGDLQGCVASKSVPLLTLDSLQPYLPACVPWGPLRQQPPGDQASQHNRPDGQTDVKDGRGGACSGPAKPHRSGAWIRETVVLRHPDRLETLAVPALLTPEGPGRDLVYSLLRGEANGLTALPGPSYAQPGPGRFQTLRVTGRT